MRKRLIGAVTVVSSLLCLGACTAWIRSVGHFGFTYWIAPERYLQLSSIDGVFGVMATRDDSPPLVEDDERLYGWFSIGDKLDPDSDRAMLVMPSFNRWGFGLHMLQTVGEPNGNWRLGGRRIMILYAPYWLPALLFAIPPLGSCLKWFRRRKRLRGGFCVSCGYDLRATSDRCPECGAATSGRIVSLASPERRHLEG